MSSGQNSRMDMRFASPVALERCRRELELGCGITDFSANHSISIFQTTHKAFSALGVELGVSRAVKRPVRRQTISGLGILVAP